MVEHILMEKGDTVIFDNQRALHGRGPYKVFRDLETSLETASQIHAHATIQ